jgi:hypothetical protein
MPNETQTLAGDCPTHGTVDAVREIPKVSFPPIVTAIMRSVAKRRRPYRCPTCDAVCETD